MGLCHTCYEYIVDDLYFQMMYLEDVVVVVRKAWVVEDMWEENQPWNTMKKV